MVIEIKINTFFQHKETPYCHVPCYSALFGPKLFGHGSQVESHQSFGKRQVLIILEFYRILKYKVKRGIQIFNCAILVFKVLIISDLVINCCYNNKNQKKECGSTTIIIANKFKITKHILLTIQSTTKLVKVNSQYKKMTVCLTVITMLPEIQVLFKMEENRGLKSHHVRYEVLFVFP